MLVLSRRKGESFLVGQATITVVELHSNRVRLAIDAPLTVAIVRDDAQKKEGEKCVRLRIN